MEIIQISTCPAFWGTRKYEWTSDIFYICTCILLMHLEHYLMATQLSGRDASNEQRNLNVFMEK